MPLYYWPSNPHTGAEGPLASTPYSRALRQAGVKNVPITPYDTYGRPSMFMGWVGPIPAPPTIPVPTPIGILPGYMGEVDARALQGPTPKPHPAGDYAPEQRLSWSAILKRFRR